MTDLKKIPIGNREGNDLSACLPERVRLQSGNAQAGMRGLVSSREKGDFSRRLKAMPKGRQRKAK